MYVAQSRLFTRKLDQAKATELVGTLGASSPFFSPDGQWVAFFAQGQLKKISVEGGAAIVLCNAFSYATGGSWGEDGNIIAALHDRGPLSRIPSAGGEPTTITELDRRGEEDTHRFPQVLPGGKAVLFTSRSSPGYDAASIEVLSLADRRRKTLHRGGAYGRYLATSKAAGYLTYVSRGTMFAMPFDPVRLEVHGAPVPVLDQVTYSAQLGYAQFDVSRTGTAVYRGAEAQAGLVTVQWLDEAGKLQPLLPKPDAFFSPRLSPDGRRLAFQIVNDLWVYEPQRDSRTRLTFDGRSGAFPVWSPDSRYIVFQGQGGIFWTRSDGAGKPQPLTRSPNVQGPWSFTPDGKRLSFTEAGPTNLDLWTVPVERDAEGLHAGKPEPFLQTPFNERNGVFSPDGRWMAYASDESGRYEVYVRAFPDTGGKWPISNSGGLIPEWSPAGHELFYRNPDNEIMVASYTVKGDSFVPEKPKVWSEKRLADAGINFRNFDLSPDSKRIAVLMPAEGEEKQNPQTHVVFLLNFFDEVRRRASVTK